jgi:hypothetical protein
VDNEKIHAKVADPGRTSVPETGRFLIGIMAGFKSEWWPVIDRNGGRLQIGIRTETVSLLRSLLQRQPRSDDEPIFVNRYGVPLGASGVRFKLAEYVAGAMKIAPSLASKHVTPHSFRHATAVHLVAAGVDVTVIRSWLGHVSLDTTNHYAQANLETKRLALERLESPSQSPKRPSWKQDQSVLAWLVEEISLLCPHKNGDTELLHIMSCC